MEKIKDILFKLFKLENIAFNLTGYVESKLELFKLEIRTDVTKALSRAMTLIFLALLGFLFLLFLSLGLAYLINSFFEAQYVGFFVIALFYGIVFVSLYINRKALTSNMEEQILKSQKNKVTD
jgi:uncharacterized membrane protein YqjE